MPQQTTQQYFKALTILHFALVIGLVLFSIIAYVVHGAGAFDNNATLSAIFQYMVPVLAFLGIAAGNVLYKKQVNEIKKKVGLAEKLNAYRGPFTLRDALLEGPALFAIIAYLLCGNTLLLGVAVLLIVVFILIRPTKNVLIKDLELSSPEMDILNDDDALISDDNNSSN
jgi:hypothetical protein